MVGRKLFELLQPFLLEHQIKMGRDRLFDVLSANYLFVRRRKKQTITTNSYHRFKRYPNLIRDFVPNAPNELWVSDITYWRIKNYFNYISIITDAYSRKIVGYHLGDSLQTAETIQALEMAISNLSEEEKKYLLSRAELSSTISASILLVLPHWRSFATSAYLAYKKSCSVCNAAN